MHSELQGMPIVIDCILKDRQPSSEADSAVYVAGLPADASEDSVKAIFAQHLDPALGGLKSVTILPARTDKPLAAAIISMEIPEQAEAIIRKMDGMLLPGLTTPLVVQKNMKKLNDNFGCLGGCMPQCGYQQMLQYYEGKGWGRGLRAFPAEQKVCIGGIPEEGVTSE